MGDDMKCHHLCHQHNERVKPPVVTVFTLCCHQNNIREGEKKKCIYSLLYRKSGDTGLKSTIYKAFRCRQGVVTSMVTRQDAGEPFNFLRCYSFVRFPTRGRQGKVQAEQ